MTAENETWDTALHWLMWRMTLTIYKCASKPWTRSGSEALVNSMADGAFKNALPRRLAKADSAQYSALSRTWPGFIVKEMVVGIGWCWLMFEICLGFCKTIEKTWMFPALLKYDILKSSTSSLESSACRPLRSRHLLQIWRLQRHTSRKEKTAPKIKPAKREGYWIFVKKPAFLKDF